jgi:hypothetical protein
MTLSKFLFYKYSTTTVIWLLAIRFQFPGTYNPKGRLITYFPPFLFIRFCLLNFHGKFSWKPKISLSSNFPCLLDDGNLEDKSVPHWGAVPHQKSSAQLWTVSDDTVPHTFEQSLCKFLFRNLEHFNCGRKFGLCACLKRMNTQMCFCACVYDMKSVHPTIIRQFQETFTEPPLGSCCILMLIGQL